MRHLNARRKLGMDSTERMSMFRNMVTSLMLHGRIRTTEPRAKELRSIADRLITLGKRVPPSALLALTGDDLAQARARRVHAIRQVRRWVHDRSALEKVFNEYAERYKDRAGGYTRLSKIGFRPGDNAPMNVVELVSEDLDAPTAGAPTEPATEPAAETPATDGA
jgi:large subunit ribosomal protein L17